MGDKDSAIASLTQAQKLAITINYAPFQEYTQSKIAEISADVSTPWGVMLQKLTQQRWVQFLMFFLLGLVVFLLLPTSMKSRFICLAQRRCIRKGKDATSSSMLLFVNFTRKNHIKIYIWLPYWKIIAKIINKQTKLRHFRA